MSAKAILMLLIVTVFGLLAGCSSTGNQGNLPLPVGDNSAQASSFQLEVLPDSYIDGSSAGGYELAVEDFGEDVVVSVKVEDARDLKALYFNLDYNPEQYRPLTANPTELLGDQGEVLSLTTFKDRGTVIHGQVLGNYEWRTGYSGDGVIAQVMFREEATPALPRTTSAVPVDNTSKSVMVYDETVADAELRWDYAHKGDYDQNGLATISDITPLGAFLGQSVAPADFPRSSKASQIDADENGAITIAELTPLGAAININSGITGYNVYCTTDDTKLPTTDNGAESDPTLRIGQVLVGDAQGSFSTDRVFFTFDLATTPAGSYYWVRPYQTDDSVEGTPSNVVGSGVNPPSLTLLSPPANGDGSSGLPYEVNPGQSYDLVLTDPADGDVSTAAETTYSSDDPSHISFASNTMTIQAGAAANFSVTGSYKGVTSNVLHFTTTTTGSGVVISPLDVTAAPWDAVPNVNDANVGTTSDDAYILHDSTFNPDGDTDGVYDLAFPLKAEDDQGADLDESALTWGSFPPFVALDINTAPKGEFHVNTFSDGYVFAQDASLNESNHLWVTVKLDIN
jgi:hypothetical protein